jgi:hypothetical protein
MKYCICTYVDKDFNSINFSEFIESLSYTSEEFFLLIVSSANKDLNNICKKFKINNFEIIENAVDLDFVTIINQCINYSSDFECSIFINYKKSLIVSPYWLSKINNFVDEGSFAMGGSVNPLKMTFSEEFNKILYSINKKDPSWIANCTNRFMISNFVDCNIFVINNKKMKEVGFLDSRYVTEKNYHIALSLKFMEKGFTLTDIPNIYSSSKDSLRYDVGDEIKNGVDIICPVVLSSVRKRLLEAMKL